MATADPLMAATKEWNKRFHAAVGQGMNPGAVQAVQAMDLKKVGLGGTAMSTQEALAAIQSASTGQTSQIHQPSTSLASIPGNFVHDIGAMAKGFGIGVAHMVEHPVRDLKGLATAPAHTLQQVTHPQKGGLSGELQAIAGSDIGKFVPGTQTAANLSMGKQGLKNMEQHPGQIAADLLPYAGKIVKALGAAGKLGDVSVSGSVAESAAKGQIGRTALRAASDGIKNITGGRLSPREGLTDVLGHYHLLQSQARVAARFNEFVKGVYTRDIKTGELAPHVRDEMFKMHVEHSKYWNELDNQRITGAGFPSDPGYVEPPLTDKQTQFMKVFSNPTPDMVKLLDKSAQDLIYQSYRNHGQLMLHGWLADNKLNMTEMDYLNHIESLPPNLRERAQKQHVNYDPVNGTHGAGGELSWMKEKKASEISGAHPDFTGEHFDTTPMVMNKDVYQIMYGKHGIMDFNPDKMGPAGQFFTKMTKGFKAAMFLRPTMLLNISIGGMIKMIGEEGPQVLGRVKEGYDLSKAQSPVTLSGGLKAMKTDQVHATMAGATMGRLYQQAKGSWEKAVNHVSSVQRAMVFLEEHEKAVKGGLNDQLAREQGMDAIRRVFVTMESMTPIERIVLKNAFPFYGFQKTLINYLAKFPSEHPFVSEVMAKMTSQETSDLKSGLPQMFQQMFQIGNPDSNGNVQSVSVAAFDPFNSLSNMFTASGFASNLNPVAKLGLAHLGVTGQGTPELYPQLTVDENTGALKAQNPSAGGIAGVLETVAPQFRTIDAMLGFNNRMKSLKVSNPSAYRAYLFQSLGIPLPQTVNVPSEVAKHEASLFKVSQRDVSAFIKTGDFGHIAGYNQVPYQGKWWTPHQLQQYREMESGLVQQLNKPGVNLKSLITPPKKAKGAMQFPLGG